MSNKSRSSWWGYGGKSRQFHSLDNLKYLYHVLTKNGTVTENNSTLLVETLRSISEILIWGDQNDSSVFDFFLEKNMLSYFARILRQKSARFIVVQLLQTLNILFENIRHETSLYYLLSNNHVNSMIQHKFDFTDEEVLAYYISFLKTLSLKLNTQTIHFFFNETTLDFPLYTEGIKFYNHSENMVRIAVRTITLNVFRVNDAAMQDYIRARTAGPYFSNLVWSIGNHALDLDHGLRAALVNGSGLSDNLNLVAGLVAEHLDYLHYVNDILALNIRPITAILSEHLIRHLFVPVYIASLSSQSSTREPRIDRGVAMFLLSHVYLIINCGVLIDELTRTMSGGFDGIDPLWRFLPPSGTVRELLSDDPPPSPSSLGRSTFYESSPTSQRDSVNATDEEKLATSTDLSSIFASSVVRCLADKADSFLLLSLSLIYAMEQNPSLGSEARGSVNLSGWDDPNPILEGVIDIAKRSCQSNSKIRPVTLELAIELLTSVCAVREPLEATTAGGAAPHNVRYRLPDRYLAQLLAVGESATVTLRNFYRTEDVFLDMFEDEFTNISSNRINVELLLMDPTVPLPPAQTPLSGIPFGRRLPCGAVERTRRGIRVYLLLRGLGLRLQEETETRLPLSRLPRVTIADKLNLTNSDLISCALVQRDGAECRPAIRRFLVVQSQRMILVEPDSKKLGWGVVQFVGSLQHVDVSGDKEDSRLLHVTIHKADSADNHGRRKAAPELTAQLLFDDHIRCMAARQRLTKGRTRTRQTKLEALASLLDIPDSASSGGPPQPSRVPPLQRRSSQPQTQPRSAPAYTRIRTSPSITNQFKNLSLLEEINSELLPRRPSSLSTPSMSSLLTPPSGLPPTQSLQLVPPDETHYAPHVAPPGDPHWETGIQSPPGPHLPNSESQLTALKELMGHHQSDGGMEGAGVGKKGGPIEMEPMGGGTAVCEADSGTESPPPGLQSSMNRI